MRGELGRVRTDDLRDLTQLLCVNTTDLFCCLWGVFAICVQQGDFERIELQLQIRAGLAQVGLPVDPTTHELTLPGAVLDQQTGDRQQQERFRTRPGSQPVVGFGTGVREPRVDTDYRRALCLSLDNPLGMRVEIVTGFEVRRDQEDHFRVGEV